MLATLCNTWQKSSQITSTFLENQSFIFKNRSNKELTCFFVQNQSFMTNFHGSTFPPDVLLNCRGVIPASFPKSDEK